LSWADGCRLEASTWFPGKALCFIVPPTTVAAVFPVVKTGDVLLFLSLRTYGGAQKTAPPQRTAPFLTDLVLR